MESSGASDRLGLDISSGSLAAPVDSVTLSGPSSSNVQSGCRPGVFPWDLGVGVGLPSRGFQAGGWSPKQVNKPGQVWGHRPAEGLAARCLGLQGGLSGLGFVPSPVGTRGRVRCWGSCSLFFSFPKIGKEPAIPGTEQGTRGLGTRGARSPRISFSQLPGSPEHRRAAAASRCLGCLCGGPQQTPNRQVP